MTIIWCTVHEISSATDRIFVILDYFLSLYLPNIPENQDFGKLKKNPGDIIILHMCTINDNHMMYGWWDIEHDGQIFLSFWTIFYTFTPKNSKNLNFEKMKKTLEIWSFYANIPKIMIICCTVPEIGCVTDVILIF